MFGYSQIKFSQEKFSQSKWKKRTAASLLLLLVCVPGWARKCYTADEASKMLNKDVCVTAHVYDVVETSDGTRFLDVCSPSTPDPLCRFTILSLYEDRRDVGELQHYRDQDVQVRGLVIPVRGRAAIVLSHARQFHDAPPRFRPNPMLSRGFDAGQERPPVSDPNLRHQGGVREFMNNRDQVSRPGK